MIKKCQFTIWCEITITVCTTLYLVILLVYRYGKKANLWIFIGMLTLSVFTLGIFIENENIKLLGFITLMNHWEKDYKEMERM